MSAPVAEDKAGFTLRGHNPDVLTCIANLSNDEVFTPPELASQMLHSVAAAWADDNDGGDIWANPDVTFLDPFTKSGVFLREIVSRLTRGLEPLMPDLWKRVDHILTKQVYGIGITQLTALLARRSVYCSKDATGEHSVAMSFDRHWGNIWFERTEHTWAGEKCAYCGASKAGYERGDDLETHAYAFIHTTDIKKRLAQMFGADVQFDVIIGNPPYQLSDGGGEQGASAAPIYQKFVQVGKSLEPSSLVMITPSRWFAGGKGLDEYRSEMLSDRRVKFLVDYPDEHEVFPGVNIAGGVSYFLWDSSYSGPTQVTTIRNGASFTSERLLDEFDVFPRDSRAVSVLRQVLGQSDGSMAEQIGSRNPFDLGSTVTGHPSGDIDLYFIEQRRRRSGQFRREAVKKNASLIDTWKVLIPKAYGGDDAIVLSKPWIVPPPSVCTESFLLAVVSDRAAAESLTSYYATRFFRFLVSLRKMSQNTTSSTYAWVPLQTWDRIWTDEALHAKYSLTFEQIEFIESQIRPMVLDNPNGEDLADA